MTGIPDPRLDVHNLGRDTNVRQLTAAEQDALLASIPRLADPLHVADDDLVERRGGQADRRARRRGHSTLALIAFLVAGIVLGALAMLSVRPMFAASRSALDDIPAAKSGGYGEPDLRGLSEAPTPGLIVEPRLTASPAPRPLIDQPAGELVTPRPVVLAAPTSGARGPASWYDDPRKAGMYAAAGPALRVGDWRGRTVTVCASTCFAVVLSDLCGCPGGRVIDLSGTAFARLAPLSRGVVQVTVTW